MPNVTVITDSVATLPPQLAQQMGVVVVPERLTLGETSYRDGDLSLEEVVSRIDEGFTTSGPSPGDFLGALEAGGGKAGALIITVSRELASSTFESAHTAARLHPLPVEVLDSGTAAGAQGLDVAAAAAVAARGEPLHAVVDEARHVADRVRLIARLDDLSWLARGGHVPYLAARAGDMVGVRPLVEVRTGRPALSVETASERLLAIWRSSKPLEQAKLHIAGLHALGSEEAVRLLEVVRSEVVPKTEFIGYFGTVMVVHSGPSLTGIAWWWDTRSR